MKDDVVFLRMDIFKFMFFCVFVGDMYFIFLLLVEFDYYCDDCDIDVLLIVLKLFLFLFWMVIVLKW